LIKRLQPAWGGKRIASRAAALTNHFTNTIPLISQLNRNLLWISLPDHILATYAQDERMVILAGPVFQNQDPVFRGIQIPCACWRIAVLISRGGRPVSLGFLATQDLSGEPTTWRRARVSVFQVQIHELGSLVRLDFGGLRSADALSQPSEKMHRVDGILGLPLKSPTDVIALRDSPA
jgi:endonuclease G